MKASLALLEEVVAEEVLERDAEEVFVGDAIGQADFAGQRDAEVEHGAVDHGDADLEAVCHAGGVGIAQEHVAHVEPGFVTRDCGDDVVFVVAMVEAVECELGQVCRAEPRGVWVEPEGPELACARALRGVSRVE